MLGPSWRQHFHLKKLRPVHERPTTFIVSQWQHDKSTPNIKYCLYRTSTFLVFSICLLLSFINETPAGKTRWPIYLTNWGYTLCTVQALLGSIMLIGSVIAEKYSRKNHWKEKVLKLYSAYWVFNIICTPVAFTISIIYWSLIYGTEGTAMSGINFMVHGMNSILMIVDLWIVSHPVHILHFIYPLMLALAYSIFTIIFFVSGGTTKTGSKYIYPILKWDEPGKTTGICMGVMLLMIFLHLFTFFMYNMRLKVYERLYLPSLDPPAPQKDNAAYVNKALANENV